VQRWVLEARLRFIAAGGPVQLNDAEPAAAQALIKDLRAQSADTERLVLPLLKRLNAPQGNAHASLLVGSRPSSAKVNATANSILSLIGMGSVIVAGTQQCDATALAACVR
jgi:hypothetical protein